MIPTKAQWRAWSLPSKLGCIGTYLGALSLILTVVFYLWPMPLMDSHKSRESTDGNMPVVSTTRIQLHDGKSVKDNEVSLFNPNEFPAHLVILKIKIDGSIPSPSVEIIMTPLAIEQSRADNNGSMESGRIDDLRENTIDFIIYTIPPKGHRTLRISGTVATNSWANISIEKFENTLVLSHQFTNTTEWPIGEPVRPGIITNFSVKWTPYKK